MTDYNTREAADEIIPELAKLFKKRRWEAESVYIALEFFLKDLVKQFPAVEGKDADSVSDKM